MAAKKVQRTSPGNDITALIECVNQLAAAMNALLTKLDADAGVTDANYKTTVGTMDTIDTITKIG